jgi:mono/diheme cytochrome c family protein
MKKPLIILGLMAALVYACNQSTTNPFTLLRAGNLPSQFFSIDVTKDTVLVTTKGAVLKFPKGTLTTTGAAKVQLEIKEAYSIQDIIRAGLQTKSNGQPLSSGGMIYINAVGESNVKITKAIAVAIPSSYIDQNMQVFKGDTTENGEVNWTDPQPLPDNPQITALEQGKALFQNNCASCHAIGKNLTGPDLAHVSKKFPYTEEGGHKKLYSFTRNPVELMHDIRYYRCLKDQFGGAVMTAFPGITESELDKLYAYIENESIRRNLPVPDTTMAKCWDSCINYVNAVANWSAIKAELEKDSNEMVIEKNNPQVDTSAAPTAPTVPTAPLPTPPIIAQPNLVKAEPGQSLYYQFNIETFGWYNIDILLKDIPGKADSELMVRIRGQYKERFSIFLIIPSIKLFIPGGPLKNAPDTYGFYEKDGSIPLPQHAQAFILAMGEYEDQVLFAKKEFVTQEKQDFQLELTAITKAAFNQQIATLNIKDLSISLSDTKNADELRTAVKELKNAQQLRPKNCDCDCILNDASAPAKADYIDSSSSPGK